MLVRAATGPEVQAWLQRRGRRYAQANRLGLRLRNLGVDRFTVWAGAQAGSVLDAVHDQSVRCAVVGLGSLPTREEQSLVAAAVLGDLWQRRQERSPVLIVIDEAHNVCPAEPPSQLVAVATDHAIRIAVTFRRGEALIAGRISPQPELLRFGARFSEEGGADVPADPL